MEENKVIDVNEVKEIKEEVNKPTLNKGNYIIEIISKGQLIKKVLVSNAEINITRLAEGGITAELPVK